MLDVPLTIKTGTSQRLLGEASQFSPRGVQGDGRWYEPARPVTDALSFDHSPYMQFLGLELVACGKGTVEIRLPFREEFLRRDDSDWLHGGWCGRSSTSPGTTP